MTHIAMFPSAGATQGKWPPVAGLDLLSRRERDADHVALQIGATLVEGGLRDITIGTHWARVGHLRHVALTIEAVGDPVVVWDTLARKAAAAGGAGTAMLLGEQYGGEPELRETLGAAILAHSSRAGGRAVIFPGWASLTGTLTVREVLDGSAIDRVSVLAGGPAEAAAPLLTRGFVRPRWSGGELVLDVQPAAGGMLIPFETPTPTPCCAQHSAETAARLLP